MLIGILYDSFFNLDYPTPPKLVGQSSWIRPELNKFRSRVNDSSHQKLLSFVNIVHNKSFAVSSTIVGRQPLSLRLKKETK